MAEDRSPRVVVAVVTVTEPAPEDELARNPAPPPYEAVTESEPIGNVVRSMLAVVMPFVVDSTELPSDAPLRMNETVPSGFAVPNVGATVAVSVTLCPDVDADGDDTRAVVVDTGATSSADAPTEAVKFASPLYVAVMFWVALVS